MIGLFVKIPFHGQLRKADPGLDIELKATFDAVSASLAASRQSSDESFLLLFDETSRSCRLRAAEAARKFIVKLEALGSRLHGWTIILEWSPLPPDEMLRSLRRLWYRIPGDGFFLGPGSSELFDGYFRIVGKAETGLAESQSCVAVLEILHSKPALSPYSLLRGPEGTNLERVAEELGLLGIGESEAFFLAVLGPAGAANDHLNSALRMLYGDASASFLRFRASLISASPYGPLLEGFKSLCPENGTTAARGLESIDPYLAEAERGLLRELSSVIDFIRRSPYRGGYSPAFDVHLRLCAAAALRGYARERRRHSMPVFIILENGDCFPRESLSLLLDMVETTLSAEGIAILVAGVRLPPGWPGKRTKRIQVSGPSPVEIAKAARRGAEALGPDANTVQIASVAAGDAFRLGATLRLAAVGRHVEKGTPTEELALSELRTFPREYAEYLLILRLGEGVLGDDDIEAFLDSMGYVAEIRSLIADALGSLGFLIGKDPPRIARKDSVSMVEEALEDKGEAVKKAFADKLRSLHESRAILPSLGLYRQIVASIQPADISDMYESDLRLFMDCLSADEIYGKSEIAATSVLPPLQAGMKAFLAAYTSGNRSEATIALEGIEADRSFAQDRTSPALSGDRAASLGYSTLSLARAALHYAERRPAPAAALAKAALMSLYSQKARRSEARAQRILGLCSLAQEQVLEGADYLSNAYEMADALQDPLESILAAQAESSAQFLLGDLGRSQSRIASAAAWASRSFRADWEAVCDFVRGRIAFELGRYDAASTAFGRVRSGARVYGFSEASLRAEIWTGRVASFLGETALARSILARHDQDAEALWFLAELESWQGDAAKAAVLAERAATRVAAQGFASADTFDWSSGYASIEGLTVGFAATQSFLADQIRAFCDYSGGLAAGGAVALEKAAHLAAMAREERLAVLHPSVHLYLLYRYRILEKNSPGSMDGASTLSKAFKALQHRASRMNESQLKDGLMDGNRWNRALLADARACKLI